MSENYKPSEVMILNIALDDEKGALKVTAPEPLEVSGEITGEVENNVLTDVHDSANHATRTKEIPPDTFPEVKKALSQTNIPEQFTTESIPCKSVLIQANENNLGTFYIGPSGVNNTSFALKAGNSLSVEIGNVNLVYGYGIATDKAVALYTAYSSN